MEVTISTKATSEIQRGNIKRFLQGLSDNVDLDNLEFLFNLSKKSGINDKLRKNKNKISTGLALS